MLLDLVDDSDEHVKRVVEVVVKVMSGEPLVVKVVLKFYKFTLTLAFSVSKLKK